jgi:hypothetical protein
MDKYIEFPDAEERKAYNDDQRVEMRYKLDELVREQEHFFDTARERDAATAKRRKYSR